MQYTIDDKGGINIDTSMECFPASEPVFLREDTRSAKMIEGLQLALSEHYTVEVQGGNLSHHCPFSREVSSPPPRELSRSMFSDSSTSLDVSQRTALDNVSKS